MATLTLRNSALIIPGTVITKSRTPEPMRKKGVAWTGTPGVATALIGKRKVFINNARIVIRQSGRKRHLSRYLMGTVNGRLVEIFLGTVRGVRNTLLKLKVALQKGALKLFSRGMNPHQRAALLLG